MKLYILNFFLVISSFCFVSCDRTAKFDENYQTNESKASLDPDELYAASQMECMKDPDGSYQKLVTAAASGHFLAAKDLASSYWLESVDYKEYGKDAVEAQINILEKAIKSNNRIYLIHKKETDLLLAKLYKKESSASYNPAKARSIYRSLSEDMSVDAWLYYANMCFDGAGGEKDLKEAYFYYSAICMVSAFDSYDAENAWEKRNEIVKKIDPSLALSELDRLRIWIKDNGMPPPTYTGYTRSDLKIEEAVRIRNEREEEHVRILRIMAGE